MGGNHDDAGPSGQLFQALPEGSGASIRRDLKRRQRSLDTGVKRSLRVSRNEGHQSKPGQYVTLHEILKLAKNKTSAPIEVHGDRQLCWLSCRTRPAWTA